MRLVTILAAGLLAGCGAQKAEPARDYTPVVWKEATPAAARAQDFGACELAAIGADPGMPQDEIRARASATSAEARLDRLSACLEGRGYTVTEGPVCTAAELSRGQFFALSATDALPPLKAVLCHLPEAGGFVVR